MPTKKLDDSDSDSDFWREFKKARAEKRGENRNASLSVLEQNHVPMLVRNNGAHIIIRFGNIWADFWPGTGLWRTYRPETSEGRGVFRLLHWLNRHEWKWQIDQPEPETKVETCDTRNHKPEEPRKPQLPRLLQPPTSTPPTLPDVTPGDSSMPPWDE